MKNQPLRFNIGNKNFYFNHSVSENPLSPQVHIHDLYELYYFLSGDVTYYIEGQAYRLKSNDILIINSKELHRPNFNSQQLYQRMTIHFKPEYISAYNDSEYNLLYYFEKRKLGRFNRINADDVLKNDIDQYLKKIEQYNCDNSRESNVMILTTFIQMLVVINKIFDQRGNILIDSPDNDKKVVSILDYLNKNLSEKITLDKLQKEFFVNKYYLCHMFKKNTGFTVQEYITYKRIMRAKELLLSGMPVLEVSSELGFGDYSNFYKVFKRTVGNSPGRFAHL